jgi:predicted phosphate transport protein (TIGR00153 family)
MLGICLDESRQSSIFSDSSSGGFLCECTSFHKAAFMRFNLFDLLVPRETKFFDYLGKQVEQLVEGGKTFKTLVDTIGSLSEEEIKRHLSIIKECESRGDQLEVTIIDELNKTFITPLDREDIHTLTINIDRALDILNSISRKIEIYKIRQMPPNVGQFAVIIEKISEQLSRLMTHLRNRTNIKDIAEQMHRLENEADELFHVSMAELFSGKYSSVEIIKFKEFYEHLESVVDAVDYVGKLIRGIKVKQG